MRFVETKHSLYLDKRGSPQRSSKKLSLLYHHYVPLLMRIWNASFTNLSKLQRSLLTMDTLGLLLLSPRLSNMGRQPSSIIRQANSYTRDCLLIMEITILIFF